MKGILLVLTGRGIKNPRLCRVNHFFEPFYQVGARFCIALGFLPPDQRTKRLTCTPQTSIGPRFKMLAQKLMLITYIAGV